MTYGKKLIAGGVALAMMGGFIALPADAQVRIDVENRNTGPFSRNVTNINLRDRHDVRHHVRVTTTNRIHFNVNTGRNVSSRNTRGGDIRSGNVMFNIHITN